MKLMNAGIRYNQRDVVLIPFPYSDLTGVKLRPALILSNAKLNKTEDRICCLITSNTPVDGIALGKNCFLEGNLPFESWVKPHRLFTINERIIKKKLCTVTKSFHTAVLQALNEYWV